MSIPNSESFHSDVCDVHIHVGKFHDRYYSPGDIVKQCQKIGLKKFAVSSTSTCDQNFNFNIVLDELQELKQLAPKKILPVLWITPAMLRKSPDLNKYDKIPYAMLKVHGFFNDWAPQGKMLQRIFAITRERNLPLLIHTGGREKSEAGVYMSLCRKFNDLKVILAHGRPIAQALDVIKSCDNVFVDTAFMPLADIKKLVDCGFTQRVIFGSDMPINRLFYPRQSTHSWYIKRLNSIAHMVGIENYMDITCHNFSRIFFNDSSSEYYK